MDASPATTIAPVSADLMQVVGRLRRTVRRRVRRDRAHRPLTESELELLRLVDEQPGLRVLDAAAALGVAPNTVSTLVGRLASGGLLERRPDPRDARAARLAVTAAARERFAAWRDRRQALVGAAMARLDGDDRRAIQACVPALRRLVELLEEE
ncbi:MAG TPA: MarR family transcriptional regulator [Actinomycetota bacterium]|jgi:DNA-binding MarR family transcriptional regulator